MRRAKTALVTTLCSMGLVAALATPAMAAFGFDQFDVAFSGEDGSAALEAGSHPFEMTTTFSVNTFVNGEGKELPEGETRNLTIRQIEGLVGNPTATPRCSEEQFITISDSASECPNATAVGLAEVRASFSPVDPGGTGGLHVPVFNLVPPPGVAAKLGFVVLNEPVTIDLTVSEEPPFEILAKIENIPQVLYFLGSEVTLWGNPAASVHDPWRGSCVGELTGETDEPVSHGLCPIDIPEKPFLTLSRACTGPLATRLEATAWNSFAPPVTDSVLTHDSFGDPQGMVGCEGLPFTADAAAQATSASADSPTGLDFDITVEDKGVVSPTGRANADIRKVEVTLPEGVTANPSAANGLGVCTLAEFESASLDSSGCPESSKLGTVEVETPVLENEILRGSVFLALPDNPSTPQPGAENPFDSLLALYFVIRNPELGISVTQVARVELDPRTGRLTTTVEDLPQFPLSRISMKLRDGPRAPLATPPTCGDHTTKTILTSWTGETSQATSSFATTTGPGGSSCPPAGIPPFSPGFEAGSTSNAAGAFSPFYIRLTRNDGEQEITRFSSLLPPGVSGKIAGLARCPEADIAAAAQKSGRSELALPSCPEASRIGRVLAGAGVGPTLTYVSGSAYLAGPFAGAPLSIVVLTPATAGPFDLGTVATREALDLDPESAQVRVDGSASEPIPHILNGIPLHLRELRVYVDRPGFTVNPTSCNPLAVQATVFGSFADLLAPADDAPTSVSERYQAAGCSALGFVPQISLRLRGGTRRGAHPALQVQVRARAGDANIGAVTATLPHSAFLEQGHLRTICTRVQFAADACPSASVYGYAKAFTPLLDEPLEGPVYLRSNGGDRELPDLVAALRGTVAVDLVGFIDSVHGRLRTRFKGAPDVPITKFVLNMDGGRKGLIANSESLCRTKQRALIRFTGHNGKVYLVRPLVRKRCKHHSR
jgi:hypothetical protein